MKATRRVLSLATILVASGLAHAQDECAGALPIAAGATPYDTTSATLSVEPWSCAGVTTAPDLWFSYTAAGNMPITVDTSMGTSCLGGDIGRGVGGAVLNSGVVGVIRATSDLTLPHPVLGMVQVMAGDTWNYQAWFRDAVGGVPTSNFSDAASVTYH